MAPHAALLKTKATIILLGYSTKKVDHSASLYFNFNVVTVYIIVHIV